MPSERESHPPEWIREIESLRERIARLEEDDRHRGKVEKQLQKERSALLQIIHTVPQSIFWKDRDGIYLGATRRSCRRWASAARPM